MATAARAAGAGDCGRACGTSDCGATDCGATDCGVGLAGACWPPDEGSRLQAITASCIRGCQSWKWTIASVVSVAATPGLDSTRLRASDARSRIACGA